MMRPDPALDHPRQHLLRDRERPEDVDLEQPTNDVDRNVGHRSGLPGTRVVDQDVDVPGRRLRHVGSGDVELLHGELRRLRAQRVGLRVGLGRRDHGVTPLRERQARTLPEARTGPRDHHGLCHVGNLPVRRLDSSGPCGHGARLRRRSGGPDRSGESARALEGRGRRRSRRPGWLAEVSPMLEGRRVAAASRRSEPHEHVEHGGVGRRRGARRGRRPRRGIDRRRDLRRLHARRSADRTPAAAARGRAARRDTAEVARIVELAANAGLPLTPRGSGTGLSGACIPSAGGVVVSFERMNEILEIDLENHVAVVQPGRHARTARRGDARARARVSGVPGRELGQSRRQRRDQRGRHARGEVRRDPPPGARARGGARHRRGDPHRRQVREGDDGLRPHAADHRIGGHARARHRGDREALPAARARRDRAGAVRRRSTT